MVIKKSGNLFAIALSLPLNGYGNVKHRIVANENNDVLDAIRDRQLKSRATCIVNFEKHASFIASRNLCIVTFLRAMDTHLTAFVNTMVNIK